MPEPSDQILPQAKLGRGSKAYALDLKNYSIKTTSRETIEAEEIFLDAQALRSLEEKGKLEQPIKRRNFILFYFFILVGLLVLLLQAGHLQIIKGEYYRNLADGNSLETYSLPAPRGIIYDRHQEPLVYNLPSFDLIIEVNDFLANPEAIQEEILRKLALILSQTKPDEEDQGRAAASLVNFPNEIEKTFKQKITQAKNQVNQLVLAENLSQEQVLILEVLIEG